MVSPKLLLIYLVHACLQLQMQEIFIVFLEYRISYLIRFALLR